MYWVLCVPAQSVTEPLPPPKPTSQCLYCKQSFLPPFILVKSFQIYYAVCWPRSGMLSWLLWSLFPSRIDLFFFWRNCSSCLKKKHDIYIIEGQWSKEKSLREKDECFCNGGFFHLSSPTAVLVTLILSCVFFFKVWNNTQWNTMWHVLQFWRNLQIPKANPPSQRQRRVPHDPRRKQSRPGTTETSESQQFPQTHRLAHMHPVWSSTEIACTSLEDFSLHIFK